MFRYHILDPKRSKVKLLSAISTFTALLNFRHCDSELENGENTESLLYFDSVLVGGSAGVGKLRISLDMKE